MKFYEIPTSEGRQLVDNQLDAKRAGVKKPKVVEYPTDKDGLRDTINGLLREIHKKTIPLNPPLPKNTPESAVEATPDPNPKFSAKNVLSKLDASVETDVDGITKTILHSKGYTLARFAEAVSVRFAELAGKKGS